MESTAVLEPRRITATNVATAFRDTVASNPDGVAIRTLGDEFTITWAQLRDRVDAIAGGFAELGLGRGDTIAIMLSNRPEFHMVDVAAITLRATAFSIYNTYAANQIQYVIADAGARIAVVEQQYLELVLEARRELPQLEHVIVVDPPEQGLADGLTSLREIEARGAGFDGEAAAAQVRADDILNLIYTSGTTGPPKGVQLRHSNVIATFEGITELIEFPPEGRVISWLPAAHIAERNAHHYVPMLFGLQITCCHDPRQILAYLPEVRPAWFFAVPRIWEKLKAGLEAMMSALGDEQREATERAIAAATDKVRLEQAGEPVPDELVAAVAKADAEIFSKLRVHLGLDQVLSVNVGAAPTPVEVLEFFHAIGIPVAEIWGMSETCGAGAVNPPGRIKIGTVGPPAPGIEIKLAADGEVLIRGGVVMAGYRNLPDKTAETIDADGWLATGDIGVLDDDGYLKIVDRKKEIIINAAGKNMSPANIEATLKSASPLLGQACVIGDARPYNTALVVLDADFAPAWAAKHGIAASTLRELAAEPAVVAAVEAGVAAANGKLARVEQIKRFKIVPGDWLPGGDELTPTMKLKRKPIAEKYAPEIEALYS